MTRGLTKRCLRHWRWITWTCPSSQGESTGWWAATAREETTLIRLVTAADGPDGDAFPVQRGPGADNQNAGPHRA